VLWLPAVNLIINLTYKPRECYFNFDPTYIIIQDTVAYLLPMFIILGITIYILKVLHEANKRRRVMKQRRDRIKGGHHKAGSSGAGAGSSPPMLSLFERIRASFTAVAANNTQQGPEGSSRYYTREATTDTNSEHSFTSERASVMPVVVGDEDRLRAPGIGGVGGGGGESLQKQRHAAFCSKRPHSIDPNRVLSASASMPRNYSNKHLSALSVSNESLSKSSASVRNVSDSPSITVTAADKKHTLAVSNESSTSANQALLGKVSLSEIIRKKKKTIQAVAMLTTQSPSLTNVNKAGGSGSRLQQQTSFNTGCTTSRQTSPCGCIKLNAYAKLYVIIATFCILWLPFCILW
jgi:hypothetical protein